MNISRTVSFGNSKDFTVDLNRPVFRYPANPILTATDVNRIWTDPALQVKTVHNAGITIFNDQTIMLFRSHLRSGISVLGLARSNNGVNSWEIEPKPALQAATKNDLFADGTNPDELIENEGGGVEDPRINRFGETFAITYSAYHAVLKDRVRVSLATTNDFKSFVRYGPVFDVDMRNVVLFNEKINGKYVALFRPNDKTPEAVGGKFTQIKIGYSSDWKSNKWTVNKNPVFETGGGPGTFSDKIGPGAPPLKTSRGWLNIFHGVRSTMDGNPYVLGVALHDNDTPSKLKVSKIPVLFPSRSDCRLREDEYIHVPNVVFTCGAIRKDDGTIFIYYGGNDTVMNLGITHEDILIELCEKYSVSG
jgi:predicted GH43/DUF377 family glycosyl hydrolase